MKLLVLVALCLVATTMAQRENDVCLRNVECPVHPACRAVGDPSLFGPNTFLSNHSFWLPFTYDCNEVTPGSGPLSEYYFFSQSGPGTFEEYPNPSDPTDIQARIGGVIENFRNSNAKWNIDSCILSGRHPAVPSEAKYEYLQSVLDSIYTPDFVAANWIQYEILDCNLSGLGYFAGASLHITRFGPAAQQGPGANNKNTNNGLAVWLTYTIDGPASIDINGRTCQRVDLPSGRHGDINIDIGVCTPCVCPPNAEIVNIDPRCIGSGEFHYSTTVDGTAAKLTFNQGAGSPVCP